MLRRGVLATAMLIACVSLAWWALRAAAIGIDASSRDRDALVVADQDAPSESPAPRSRRGARVERPHSRAGDIAPADETRVTSDVVVVDADGSTVRSVNVNLDLQGWLNSLSDLPQVVRSPAAGSSAECAISGLRGWRLSVSLSSQACDDTSFVASVHDVTLGDGPIRLVVDRGERVWGRVTAPDGAGVASYVTYIRSEESSERLHGVSMTDGNGDWSARGFTPGTYRVEVRPVGQDGLFEHGIAVRTFKLPLDGPLTLTLDRTGAVTGTVVDPDGRPVQGVLVVAALASDQEFLRSSVLATDDNGRFLIPGLDPTVRYRIDAGDESAWTDATAYGGADVRVVRQPGRAVNCVLRDDRSPAPGLTVVLTEPRTDRERERAVSDADGWVVIPVAEDSVRELGVVIGEETVVVRDLVWPNRAFQPYRIHIRR